MIFTAYRNWMNSMGVSPYVNNIYNDLQNGLIIFQLYDIIKPGIVDWKKVHKKFSKLKAFMEKLGKNYYKITIKILYYLFNLIFVDVKRIVMGLFL